MARRSSYWHAAEVRVRYLERSLLALVPSALHHVPTASPLPRIQRLSNDGIRACDRLLNPSNSRDRPAAVIFQAWWGYITFAGTNEMKQAPRMHRASASPSRHICRHSIVIHMSSTGDRPHRHDDRATLDAMRNGTCLRRQAAIRSLQGRSNAWCPPPVLNNPGNAR